MTAPQEREAEVLASLIPRTIGPWLSEAEVAARLGQVTAAVKKG